MNDDMIDQASIRSELFTSFAVLTDLIPEMRAGQLIAAVGELCNDLHGRGLWDATDAELLESLWQFRQNYKSVMTRS